MKFYIAIFSLSLMMRVGCGVFLQWRTDRAALLEFPDEQQYWLMAQSLASGDGLRDELGFRATRMPLYPGLLSMVTPFSRGVLMAKSAQWILGALQAVFVAALAARWTDRRTALLAALAVALDPFLVFFSSLLLTETLFTTLVAALVWLVAVADETPHRFSCWMAISLTAIACLYTRESAVLLLFMLGCWLILHHGRDRRTVKAMTLAAVIVALSLVPWALRNRRTLGEWCILTTRGGISLYDGVGPRATGASDLGDIKQMPAVSQLTEGEWNRYFMAESIRAMQMEPLRILRLACVKLKRTWNPWPNEPSYRSGRSAWVAVAWTLPTYILAAAGAWLWMRRSRDWAWKVALLLLPAAHVVLLHSLFVGSVRYRIPAMPLIDLLAAAGVAALIGKMFRQRTPGSSSSAS